VDVLVDGLETATAYVYRVIVQSGSDMTISPTGRFRTAPAPGQSAAFAVLSDTQWQWEGVNRLAVIGAAVAFDSARSGGFDFVLHAGDVVETPNAYYWEPWFQSFEPMLLAAPFVPVLGNHEKNSVSYYNAFSHPSGAGQNDERWWTLHWGDVVIVGLDTSVTRADRILEQQAYARAELAGPERWKFVLFHHPVYSSDAYHGSGYGYDTIYHPIFVESGVDIVFNGHAHNYERIEKDGVIYLVLGGGGAVPRPLAPTRVEGSVVAIEDRNFYARVSTTPEIISVDIVSVAEATETTFTPTSGELLDSFTLRARKVADVTLAPPESLASAEATTAVQTASEMPASVSEMVPATTLAPGGTAVPVATVAPETVQSEPLASEPAQPLWGKPAKPVTAFEPPPATTGMPSIGLAALVAIAAIVIAIAWVFLRAGR
jgi:predicted phosphodiesterase